MMHGWPYNAARGLAPLPPPPPSYGPSRRDCGGPRESPTPPGVPQCLVVPPLDAIGDCIRARARVSLGLRLAPALLLGHGLPLTLSGLTPTIISLTPTCLGNRKPKQQPHPRRWGTQCPPVSSHSTGSPTWRPTSRKPLLGLTLRLRV
jgi:hypothetical protein